MGSGHDHAGAASGNIGAEARRRRERSIGAAALLTGSFMFAEFAGGLISGSLALLADAGHMLTDFASLLLAWLALRLARRYAIESNTK